MTIAKWPGSLWRAEVIDEAKNTCLRENAKYTRANGVKLIEKLPLSILFGGYGAGILRVIELTSDIDLDIAKKLAGTFPEQALELYSKGWNIYGGTKSDQPPFYGRNHQNTIAMPGGEGCSPINNAFTIIYSQVFDKANLSLDDEWSKTCNSYLCAAMAIAYQEKFSGEAIALLSKAWKTVYGNLTIKA